MHRLLSNLHACDVIRVVGARSVVSQLSVAW